MKAATSADMGIESLAGFADPRRICATKPARLEAS
jgi:hypothetical protein